MKMIKLLFKNKCFYAFFTVLILAVFSLTFSVNIHAAIDNTSLPYVVNSSYTLTDVELSFISDVLDHFNFHSLDEPVIIFKEAEGWWYDYSNNVGCLQYRLYFPTVTQQALLPTSTWHDNKTFSNFVLYDSNCYFDVNFIDVPSMRITKRGINQNYNNAWEVSYGVDSSVWRRFYGTYEVRHENNISGEFDWVPNYPVYTNFSWGTSDGYTQDTFLTFFVPGNSVGSVSPIFDNLSPVYDVGATLPVMVPPNVNLSSYNWTSKPIIDFSTLEKAVESCADLLEWLGDNISGSFSNIIGNIQSVVNNITQTIQYYGNLIIANIQNGIQNLYDNMVGLIEPLIEPILKIGTFFGSLVALGTAPGTDEFSISYLTENLFMPEPEDVQEIMESNDSLHIISNLDRIVDKVWTSETSIIKTLHNVTPVKKFHIPSCFYHGVQIGNYDIEFDWFENYKTYSDSIISTFLIIAWIYWFFVSISHIIRYGKTYDVDDTTKGVHF